MTGTDLFLLFVAGLGGGVMNALAGGGTLLTFPSLLFLGQEAVVANATSAVALAPGALASMLGYRREVATHAAWLKTLALPSLVGGGVGAALLLRTSERVFADVAPVLVLFATLLFAVQGIVKRWFSTPADGPPPRPASRSVGRWSIAVGAQLLVALYGGYFGAGIGILMLAVLGFLGLSDIHAMNGLKNFFGFCIKSVAAATFVVQGAVAWPAALAVMAGATIGGFGGANFGRLIGQRRARIAVVVIGTAITIAMAWRQWG